MKIKRMLKFSILLIVLGICAVYTYGFVTGSVVSVQTEDDATEEEMEDEGVGADSSKIAVYQTPAPEQMNKIQDIWEKIKYAYLPNLSDLKWVELGEEYLLVKQNVTYKVLDASISKKWNLSWNFDVVKGYYSFEDYIFDEKHNLKSKDSFLSIHVQLENQGSESCSCCLANNYVQIYNKGGKNVDIGDLCTMSINKKMSKTVYFEKLKPHERLDVELVYILKDKSLSDANYYFWEVVPGDSYPPSTDWVGVFKLPLGVEGEKLHDKK